MNDKPQDSEDIWYGPPSEYVSIIVGALFHPLIVLIGKLYSTKTCHPNEVQTNQMENGYSVSIIILAALILEAAIQRTAYVRKEIFPKPVFKYLEGILKNNQTVLDVEEVFVLRDVIAHNHLWEGEVSSDADGLKFSKSPQLIAGGDVKHRRVFDQRERVTKRLRLNVFPPRIWRKDAWEVIHVMWKVILDLEAIDRRYVYLSQIHYETEKGFKKFEEILKGIEPQS